MIASCDNRKWKDTQALKDAVGEWSDRIKVQVLQIQLRPMKRKWGIYFYYRTLNAEY
jgi:predicted metal-dependent hydrolase